jgi:hypothetical protein
MGQSGNSTLFPSDRWQETNMMSQECREWRKVEQLLLTDVIMPGGLIEARAIG